VDVVTQIKAIGQGTLGRIGLDKVDKIAMKKINCGAIIILAVEK